jgi:hypothetical protein
MICRAIARGEPSSLPGTAAFLATRSGLPSSSPNCRIDPTNCLVGEEPCGRGEALRHPEAGVWKAYRPILWPPFKGRRLVKLRNGLSRAEGRRRIMLCSKVFRNGKHREILSWLSEKPQGALEARVRDFRVRAQAAPPQSCARPPRRSLPRRPRGRRHAARARSPQYVATRPRRPAGTTAG